MAIKRNASAHVPMRVKRANENRESWSVVRMPPGPARALRKLGSKPLDTRLVAKIMTAKVIADCSITLTAVVSIDGTIISGCLLHVQYDL